MGIHKRAAVLMMVVAVAVAALFLMMKIRREQGDAAPGDAIVTESPAAETGGETPADALTETEEETPTGVLTETEAPAGLPADPPAETDPPETDAL